MEDDEEEEEGEKGRDAQPQPEQEHEGRKEEEGEAAVQQQQQPEQQETSEKKKKSALQGLHVRRLLRRFLGTEYDPLAARDEWQHVASVLHNVSQLQVCVCVCVRARVCVRVCARSVTYTNNAPTPPRQQTDHTPPTSTHTHQNNPTNPPTQQKGRDLLRRRQTDILRVLLPQLQSRNPVRRRGVASALRNCCFEGGCLCLF